MATDPLHSAALTWKLRQEGRWLSVSCTLPPEAGARVVCTLLREFVGRCFTPAEVSITGDGVRQFRYVSDGMTLNLRRVRSPRGG